MNPVRWASQYYLIERLTSSNGEKINIEEIEQCFLTGELNYTLEDGTSVPIADFAPDIALVVFNGDITKYDEVKIDKELGEGGYAKVYKGTWNDKVVALKELFLNNCDVCLKLVY